MKRGKAYFRWQRIRCIQRKRKMLLRYGGYEYIEAWTQGKLGKLSKGKIHCSCPMCRRKSYDEPKHRDVVRGAWPKDDYDYDFEYEWESDSSHTH